MSVEVLALIKRDVRCMQAKIINLITCTLDESSTLLVCICVGFVCILIWVIKFLPYVKFFCVIL